MLQYNTNKNKDKLTFAVVERCFHGTAAVTVEACSGRASVNIFHIFISDGPPALPKVYTVTNVQQKQCCTHETKQLCNESVLLRKAHENINFTHIQ
jgi:hypothetical protein